jgi:predicted permease
MKAIGITTVLLLMMPKAIVLMTMAKRMSIQKVRGVTMIVLTTVAVKRIVILAAMFVMFIFMTAVALIRIVYEDEDSSVGFTALILIMPMRAERERRLK